MKQYNDVGNGALFNNGQAEGKRPPYSGPLEIEGRKLQIAAWVKEKDGKRFFSIKVTEVVELDEEPKASFGQQTREPIDDADIPF